MIRTSERRTRITPRLLGSLGDPTPGVGRRVKVGPVCSDCGSLIHVDPHERRPTRPSRAPGPRGAAGARREDAQHPLPRLGGHPVRRQVVDLVRRALHLLREGEVRQGRAGAEVRQGARDRVRYRLLHREPLAGGAGAAGVRDGHLPGDGRGLPAQRAATSASRTSRGAPPTRRPCRTRRDRSTSSSDTRSSITCPTFRPRWRSAIGCSSPAACS